MLARYINLNFPEYYKYYSQPEFTWNKISQQNRNPLLRDYPGADGMKTGYTKEAGYGLVGSATRGNRRLIMVIAGLKSLGERKQEAQKLMDWGFSQFRSIAVYDKGDRVSKATVWGGASRSVDLITTDLVRDFALAPGAAGSRGQALLPGAADGAGEGGRESRNGALHRRRQHRCRSARGDRRLG